MIRKDLCDNVKLSDLQKTMLRMASEKGGGIDFSSVFANFYGWAQDEKGHFSKSRIGMKPYMAAKVAVKKSADRLVKRGLILVSEDNPKRFTITENGKSILLAKPVMAKPELDETPVLAIPAMSEEDQKRYDKFNKEWGKKKKEIDEEFGVTPKAAKGSRLTADEDTTIRAMYLDRDSVSNIAIEINRSESTVRGRIQKLIKKGELAERKDMTPGEERDQILGS